MKKLILLTFMLLSGFSLSAQSDKSEFIQVYCDYDSVSCKFNNVPLLAQIALSAASKETKSGMKIGYGYDDLGKRLYGLAFSIGQLDMVILCYYKKQLSDGRYVYSGTDLRSLSDVVIYTKTKLSEFSNKDGIKYKDSRDLSKNGIRMLISGGLLFGSQTLDISLYPTKNKEQTENN